MTQQPWPAATTETAPWHRGQTYQAAIPPMIADSNSMPSPSVVAISEEAARSLVRFDERYGRAVGGLMLRAEALASSRLEGIRADARSLCEAEMGVVRDPEARLVASNVRALESLLGASLGTAGVREAHGVLLAGDPHSGAWRDQQAWIGGWGSPVGAHFVPPVHGRVPALVDDLMTYTRRIDLPPVAQAAIAHAQFETIHPFTDGNGRTGRALVNTMLQDAEISTHSVMPLSAGLIAHKEWYYSCLDAYREGNVDPIVELFTDALFRAVGNGTHLSEEAAAVAAGWRERLTARADAAVWPVLDLLAKRPAVNAAVLESELGLDYSRSKRAMDTLAEAGIVEAVGKHQQGRYWVAPEMLAALDSFIERSWRR